MQNIEQKYFTIFPLRVTFLKHETEMIGMGLWDWHSEWHSNVY